MKNEEFKMAIEMVIKLYKESESLDCWGNKKNQKTRDQLIWRAENLRNHLLREFEKSGYSKNIFDILLENADALRISWRSYCPVAMMEEQFGLFREDGQVDRYGSYALSREGDFVAWANGINLYPYCYQAKVGYDN